MKYYTMSKDFIKIYIIWRYKDTHIHDQFENITKAKEIIQVTINGVLQEVFTRSYKCLEVTRSYKCLQEVYKKFFMKFYLLKK